jgi:hypothetical protein
MAQQKTGFVDRQVGRHHRPAKRRGVKKDKKLYQLNVVE